MSILLVLETIIYNQRKFIWIARGLFLNMKKLFGKFPNPFRGCTRGWHVGHPNGFSSVRLFDQLCADAADFCWLHISTATRRSLHQNQRQQWHEQCCLLTLGSKGKHFINALFYLLLVCMLIAYILGVGDIIHKLLLDVGVDISSSVAYTIFSLLMGVIVVSR